MSEESGGHRYRIYVIILGILLVLTLSMIFIGESNLAPVAQVPLLLLGAAIKAALIIFYFMHLKFEKFGLIMIVMVGIFVTSLLMFVVPAYDGASILDQSLWR